MAVALVGSVGAVTVGAGSGAVTPAWGASENRVAGNLLVCWVGGIANTATPNPATPSGWSASFVANAASCGVIIFYKFAAGADAAPTIAAQSAVTWTAQLAEFSGVTSLDQTNFGATGTTSPLTAVLGSVDATVGELLLYSSAARYSPATAGTLTNALNNASAVSTNNNGVSALSHYDFGYGITTSRASADSDSFSLTTTNLTRGAVVIASFKATTVYTDAPSGSIASSGTSADVRIGSGTPAGSLTATGSITDAWQHSDTSTGSVTLSGSNTGSRAYTDISTASLALNGTLIEAHGTRFIDQPAGTVTLNGSATESLARSSTPTGILEPTGQPGEQASHSSTSIGILILTGVSTEAWKVVPRWNETPGNPWSEQTGAGWPQHTTTQWAAGTVSHWLETIGQRW